MLPLASHTRGKNLSFFVYLFISSSVPQKEKKMYKRKHWKVEPRTKCKELTSLLLVQTKWGTVISSLSPFWWFSTLRQNNPWRSLLLPPLANNSLQNYQWPCIIKEWIVDACSVYADLHPTVSESQHKSSYH